MTLNGLCFITYDGKKVVGRPSNSFKQALEKAEKSFFGQIRVIKNSEGFWHGLEILRNGQMLLKTSNINHIKFNLKNNAFVFTFFGNKIPNIIEFADKSVLTGFQMDSTHFVRITVHMHFISSSKDANEVQNNYTEMIHNLEKIVHENHDPRNVAIGNLKCNEKLLKLINGLENQENIQNIAAGFLRRKRIPQQANKKPLCTRRECQCQNCLSKKQEEINSLTKEYEQKLGDAIQKMEELEDNLVVVEKLHQKEAKNVVALNDKLNERNDKISKQAKKIEQLETQLDTKQRQNDQLQRNNNEKAQRIQELEKRIRELQNIQQPVSLQEGRKVYVTQTGHCYHSHLGCPSLSRSYDVQLKPLLHVQGSLRECMRC
jgi:polyhydroxyalkanoate synthesis regulator phasin